MDGQRRQQDIRGRKRQAIQSLCEENVEVAAKLKRFNREVVGRPRVEVDQPALLSTIVDIAQQGSSADERRQTEMLRSVTNLDQLAKELQQKGFTLSRTALYLRLLPRRSNSAEGRRHVKTVPVKLVKRKFPFLI